LGLLQRSLASKRTVFWTGTAVTLAADQLTKLLLWRPPGDGVAPIVIIAHVLRFVPHEGNKRGALGLGPDNPAVWIVAAVVGVALIGCFHLTAPEGKPGYQCALGLLAGGAVGNLIDRLLKGFVRDFIDLRWYDTLYIHTFNVADAAICVGFVLVVLDTFLSTDVPAGPPRRRRPRRKRA